MEAYFALYSIIAHEVAWRSINNVDIDMTMLQSKSETWLNVDWVAMIVSVLKIGNGGFWVDGTKSNH